MSTLPGGTVTFVFTDIEGLDAPAAGARRRATPRSRASTAASSARRSARTAAPRSTRRATRSSSRSRARGTRSPPRSTRSARCATTTGPAERRCECGWGCTPASRTSATRATSGSTSCAPRGSRAAGHGGQILLSETTRALLGNQLPEGVAVHDLGEQHLKDIQHEHVYELSVDGAPARARSR